MARTWNVWLPCERPVKVMGLEHVVKAPPSSEHWNVADESFEENVKVALVLGEGFGGFVRIAVSGAIVSTTHV